MEAPRQPVSISRRHPPNPATNPTMSRSRCHITTSTAEDVVLDESGVDAAELLMRQLGAQIIDEQET